MPILGEGFSRGTIFVIESELLVFSFTLFTSCEPTVSSIINLFVCHILPGLDRPSPEMNSLNTRRLWGVICFEPA